MKGYTRKLTIIFITLALLMVFGLMPALTLADSVPETTPKPSGWDSEFPYTPTPEPTNEPTATPEPTAAPTDEPTAVPEPTAAPTDEPTATPEPTAAPTDEPTAAPEPTSEPTTKPSITITSPTDGQTIHTSQSFRLAWTEVEGAVYIVYSNGSSVPDYGPCSYTSLRVTATMDQAVERRQSVITVVAVDSNAQDVVLASDSVTVTLINDSFKSTSDPKPTAAPTSKPSLRVTSPKDGTQVPANQPLTVSWTKMEGVDYYVVTCASERYTVSRDKTSYTLDASLMQENPNLKITVSAQFTNGKRDDDTVSVAVVKVSNAQILSIDMSAYEVEQGTIVYGTVTANADTLSIDGSVCAPDGYTEWVNSTGTPYDVDAATGNRVFEVWVRCDLAGTYQLGLTPIADDGRQGERADQQITVRQTDDPTDSIGPATVLSASATSTVMNPNNMGSVLVTCDDTTACLVALIYNEQGVQVGYETCESFSFGENGERQFQVDPKSLTQNGKYKLRFIAMDEQKHWLDDSTCQQEIDLIVCDHTIMDQEVERSQPVYVNEQQHKVMVTYQSACVCGAHRGMNQTQKEEFYPHDAQGNHELNIEPEHVPDLGHRAYYVCSCGETIFLEGYVALEGCVVCQGGNQDVSWVQQRLIDLGYNPGAVDGKMGQNTSAALMEFQRDHGLLVTGYINDETIQALSDAKSAPETNSGIQGTFDQSSYTMSVGGTLDVGVIIRAPDTDRVYLSIDVQSPTELYDGFGSAEITEAYWYGPLHVDGTVQPFNTAGTYTLKLRVSLDAAKTEWIELDQATLTVQ